MSQTWLVYGSKGWIGEKFVSAASSLPSVIPLCGKARCDNFADLKAEILSLRPDRVISLIGRTSGPAPSGETEEVIRRTDTSTIDWLEAPGHLRYNLRDNLYAPLLMERVCSDLGIHFTYMGTGCIFVGEEIPFTEDAEPTFYGSAYSTVKGFTDRLMHFSPHTLNVRIRMPIVREKCVKNFLTKILSYEKINSSLNSMTVLEDMIPILCDLVLQGFTGTYHLVNPGPMTHAEILDLYKEIVDPNFTYRLMGEDELRLTLKAERSRCVLDTTAIEKMYHPPTLKESLVRIFSASREGQSSAPSGCN